MITGGASGDKVARRRDRSRRFSGFEKVAEVAGENAPHAPDSPKMPLGPAIGQVVS
jgi:hypothetical protein